MLEELLKKIDNLQVQIDAFGKFDENVLKQIRYKFRLDWNYYSNKMEGGTLTREETRSVMVGNVTVGGKPIKDVMEMKGHDDVISDILKIGKGELKISEKRIKDIHRAIMHEESPNTANLIGEWKRIPNEVINYKGEKISFALPDEVPEKIHGLLNIVNTGLEKINSKTGIHPLILASDFHLEYVTIHPFYDGNGRTTRILTNLILISCGFPPIIIKESEKAVYYQYLADIQAYGGNKILFYEFMADKLLQSQQLVLDALNGKGIEEPDDVRKEIELLKKRLSDKDYSRSPKNIYNVYGNVGEEIWARIQETLKSFDEFYSESKTMRFLNHMDEEYGTYNIMKSLVGERSAKPAGLKIFGHNIYDTDVHHIQWQRTQLGLKGATKKNSCVIALSLQFQQRGYEMKILLNNNSIFSKIYGYTATLGLDEIEQIKMVLGKELVKNIKENTED